MISTLHFPKKKIRSETPRTIIAKIALSRNKIALLKKDYSDMAKEKKVSVREGKNKIRQTKEWKQFRKGLGDERKVDALTNKKLTRCWNLHHMRLSQDLEEYADLQPELFECLNRQSHDVLHFLYRYFVNDESIIDRLRDLLERMKELGAKKD